MGQTYYFILYYLLLVNTPPKLVNGEYISTLGRTDSIFRTAMYALVIWEKNLDLARRLLWNCFQLIRSGDRWPDALDFQPKQSGFRTQRSMTRDPYVTTRAAIHLRGLDDVLKLKLKWWLFRVYIWNWMKYLDNGKKAHLRRYERALRRLLWWGSKTQGMKTFARDFKIKSWRPFKFSEHIWGIHGYSLHLWAWTAYTAGSKTAQDLVYKYTSDWNLELRLLCNKEVGKWEIDSYISVEGYRWTGEYWKENKEPIPVEEPIHLDKDIIKYLWERKYQTGTNS